MAYRTTLINPDARKIDLRDTEQRLLDLSDELRRFEAESEAELLRLRETAAAAKRELLESGLQRAAQDAADRATVASSRRDHTLNRMRNEILKLQRTLEIARRQRAAQRQNTGEQI